MVSLNVELEATSEGVGAEQSIPHASRAAPFQRASGRRHQDAAALRL